VDSLASTIAKLNDGTVILKFHFWSGAIKL
jgi:hypothetical protein